MEKLHYETSIDRRRAVHARRSRLLDRFAIAVGVLLVLIILGSFLISYLMSHEDDRSLKLTVVNQTGMAVEDAGFCGIYNERVISVGPVAIDATVKKSINYNVNDCPAAFSFDQKGKTLYAPIDQEIEGESNWTVTLVPGEIVARRVGSSAIESVATTQPIKY